MGDSSNNHLTDAGANQIMNYLLERQVCTRRVKLYKNDIKEPSALCRYLEDRVTGIGMRDGINGLHLSDNQVSGNFFSQIMEIICSQRKHCSRDRPPFWLRMEKNPLRGSDVKREIERAEAAGLK